MFEFVDEQDVEPVDNFFIDGPSSANWAVEIVKEERSRRDIFVEAAQDKIKHLQEQIQLATEKCDSSTAYLLFALNDYLDTVPAKMTKTLKQLELPGGKIVRTLAKKDYSYEPEKLVAYLQENAVDYIKSEPKAKWGEFKKDLEIQGDIVIRVSTGEVVECVKVVEKPSTCEVK